VRVLGRRDRGKQVTGPLRVLVLAFACAPQRGSEAGSGWGVVQALVHEGVDVTAVVSPDHRTQRQEWLRVHGSDRLRFVEVPIPRLGERVRRSKVLSRPLWHLAYLRWLHAALPTVRKLAATGHHDVLLYTGYGSYWMPAPGLDDLPLPVAYGPVGGGTRTPWRLWPYLGIRGLADEFGKRAAVRAFSWLPSTRRTWRAGDAWLVENDETRQRLPRRLRAQTGIANRAVLAEAPSLPSARREPFLLFPSAIAPRKGWRLALHALARTPDHVRLVVVNDGPELPHLRKLAARLGVTERVDFLGRVPRGEMFELMGRAAAVVFCGLREEGGLALSEAMLTGAPAVVLAHGGARHIAQQALDPSRVALVDATSRQGAAEGLGRAMAALVANPPQGAGPYLDQGSTRSTIVRALHAAALARPPRAGGELAAAADAVARVRHREHRTGAGRTVHGPPRAPVRK
jgi:glycosyltransferase involved in cell wall biosynthesis